MRTNENIQFDDRNVEELIKSRKALEEDCRKLASKGNKICAGLEALQFGYGRYFEVGNGATYCEELEDYEM